MQNPLKFKRSNPALGIVAAMICLLVGPALARTLAQAKAPKPAASNYIYIGNANHVGSTRHLEKMFGRYARSLLKAGSGDRGSVMVLANPKRVPEAVKALLQNARRNGYTVTLLPQKIHEPGPRGGGR